MLPAPETRAGRGYSLSWRVVARRAVGFAILLAGAGVVAGALLDGLAAGDPRLTGALLGGLMAGGATALGTLPVLFSSQISQRTNDVMLGFGAGVMLAASSFSLVIPALDAASAQGLGPWAAGTLVGAGVLGGAALLLLVGQWMPSPALPSRSHGDVLAIRRAWIFVIAISMHNVPEGLAIGVAFAGDDFEKAHALATGISIQDIPEGLVVALALRSAGYGRAVSVAFGMASGVIEPIAAVLGAVAISISAALLPWGLAAAAGAMLFVISHHVIPGAARQGNPGWATSGLMVGFVVMMVLDTALG